MGSDPDRHLAPALGLNAMGPVPARLVLGTSSVPWRLSGTTAITQGLLAG